MSKRPSKKQAAAKLAAIFERNGYIRRQNPARIAEQGRQRYKKGSEVRLVAVSAVELAQIREFLDVLDFKPGRTFAKAQQYCIPLYGHEQTARFAELVGKV